METHIKIYMIIIEIHWKYMIKYLMKAKGGVEVKTQVLVDYILDKLPADYSIKFTFIKQGNSMSKIKYYVN